MTNREGAATPLRRSAPVGVVLCWDDVLHEGRGVVGAGADDETGSIR